jgi:RimJ/RimL family protein N-acetyltransferase
MPEPALTVSSKLTATDLPLRTERLVIRAFRSADAEDLFAYRSQPEVTRYLYREPEALNACTKLVRGRSHVSSLVKANAITLACELSESSQLIGEVTLLWVKRDHLQGELGFVFNPDFHGRGLATRRRDRCCASASRDTACISQNASASGMAA